MARRPPTDLEILEEIYKNYYATFVSYSRGQPNRIAKMYVPIDIEAIAKHFSVDPDIIFGRLYYHLDRKYGFAEKDGAKVPFFAARVGSDKHTVQFPLLAAVIASLREERNNYLVATWISFAAVSISIISLLVSFLWSK